MSRFILRTFAQFGVYIAFVVASDTDARCAQQSERTSLNSVTPFLWCNQDENRRNGAPECENYFYIDEDESTTAGNIIQLCVYMGQEAAVRCQLSELKQNLKNYC